MVTIQRKREIRQKIRNEISEIITDFGNDEEFFIALLAANQYIANELSNWDDIFDD